MKNMVKKFAQYTGILMILSLVVIIPLRAKAANSDFVIKSGVLTEYKGSAEKVTIPNTVKKIGGGAFFNRKRIKSVTIPATVTTIENGAFQDCSKLATITIPKSVKKIENGVFDGTAWLKAKQEKNPLVIVNGILIDGTTCKGKVTIPKSVKRINDYAFIDSSLESVTIPSSVTSIGDSAFANCSNIKSITIPSSVKSIEKGAFTCCNNLSTISIPNSVKSIGEDAFAYCNQLNDSIVTIVGSKGSYAESYAKKYDNLKFTAK